MSWPSSFTLSSWLLSAITVFLLALAWAGWRNRSMPGGAAFALGSLLSALWAAGLLFESPLVEPSGRIAWAKFQAVWQMPTFTAMTCFVLDYAQPGRWLTRRNIALLSIPVVLVTALVLTNDLHHWVWLGFTAQGEPVSGTLAWVFIAYAFGLAAINLVVFGWLFMRSPMHRWPVALMIFGQLSGRAVFVLQLFGVDVSGDLEPYLIMFALPFGMYAIALFGFRIFDPVPLARETAIEHMQEGMLVADLHGQVLYMNPMAEAMVGLPTKRARGRNIREVLPPVATTDAPVGEADMVEREVQLGTGESQRYFVMHRSRLIDRRGVALGTLLLLQDITGRRRAQAQLVEEQNVVSALRERQHLARELHDSLGQVLAYISMQAQAVRKRVHDGRTDAIETQLVQLAEAAQAAHQDVRGSILNLKTGPAERWSFFSALRDYLAAYQQQYGIRAELCIPEGMAEDDLAPGAGVQLLRVIQEALTNARNHGKAHRVQVTFAVEEGEARIVVVDDGRGFDPNTASQLGNGHFGLAFMRERMAQIAGSLAVDTRPGAGTRILLRVPLRDRDKEVQP